MSMLVAPASSSLPHLYRFSQQILPDLLATVTIRLAGHYHGSCCPLTPPDLTSLVCLLKTD